MSEFQETKPTQSLYLHEALISLPVQNANIAVFTKCPGWLVRQEIRER